MANRGQSGWKSRGRIRTEWMRPDGKIKAELVDGTPVGSSGHTINAEQFGAWTYGDGNFYTSGFPEGMVNNLVHNNEWLLTRFEESVSEAGYTWRGELILRSAVRQGYRTFS